jgi:DNA-binding Xre family transcriptional regulator
MIMLRRLRSLIAYHGESAKSLSDHLGLSANTMSGMIRTGKNWDLKTEVIPVIEFFRERGGEYTVEYVFEELF